VKLIESISWHSKIKGPALYETDAITSAGKIDLESATFLTIKGFTYKFPIRETNCEYWQDGGSVGYVFEDRNGMKLKLLVYRGSVNLNWENRVYLGTDHIVNLAYFPWTEDYRLVELIEMISRNSKNN
jgi:hypothetical protein